MRVAVAERRHVCGVQKGSDLDVIARRRDLAAALIDVLAGDAEGTGARFFEAFPLGPCREDVELRLAGHIRAHLHERAANARGVAELVLRVRAVGFALRPALAWPVL